MAGCPLGVHPHPSFGDLFLPAARIAPCTQPLSPSTSRALKPQVKAATAHAFLGDAEAAAEAFGAVLRVCVWLDATGHSAGADLAAHAVIVASPVCVSHTAKLGCLRQICNNYQLLLPASGYP